MTETKFFRAICGSVGECGGGGTLREESGVKNVQVECHKIDSSKPTKV